MPRITIIIRRATSHKMTTSKSCFWGSSQKQTSPDGRQQSCGSSSSRLRIYRSRLQRRCFALSLTGIILINRSHRPQNHPKPTTSWYRAGPVSAHRKGTSSMLADKGVKAPGVHRLICKNTYICFYPDVNLYRIRRIKPIVYIHIYYKQFKLFPDL